jgi:hypothetical protein
MRCLSIAALPQAAGRRGAALRRQPDRMRRSQLDSARFSTGAARRVQLVAGAAEAALAHGVRRERGTQRRLVEIRPQDLGEIQLGVSQVPQAEVAHALLAPGADEQVGLGRIGQRQVGRQVRLVEAGAAIRVVAQQPVDCLHDVPAPAVVCGDGEGEPRVGRSQGFGFAHQRDDARLEAGQIAHHFQPDVVLVQPRDLALERAQEQLHQEGHFLRRPAPVLAAEGEQGEVLDAGLDAAAGDRAHAFQAAAMPRHARQHALLGPAPVAVHDHRHVARHRAGARDADGRAVVEGHAGARSP